MGGGLAVAGVGRVLRSGPCRRVRASPGECDHHRQGGVLLGPTPGEPDGRKKAPPPASRPSPSQPTLSGPLHERARSAHCRLESGGPLAGPGAPVGRGTVRLSKERLFGLAESTGFRPDLLEKAVQLLHLIPDVAAAPGNRMPGGAHPAAPVQRRREVILGATAGTGRGPTSPVDPGRDASSADRPTAYAALESAPCAETPEVGRTAGSGQHLRGWRGDYLTPSS